jgi:hypothetical protein
LVRAPLVFLAIAVLYAFDALVSIALVAGGAIAVALALDALVSIADVVPATVVVIAAPPGPRTVGQASESDQTERATGGGLEHATTPGLRSQDAGEGIKPIGVHDLLLCARCLDASGPSLQQPPRDAYPDAGDKGAIFRAAS